MPSSAARHSAEGLGGLALALLVVLVALVHCWHYTEDFPGEDFYIAWSAGRHLTDSADAYSLEGRLSISEEMMAYATRPGAPPGLDAVAARHKPVNLPGTPFFYALYHVASTDDYRHDYFWFRVVQLIATAIGIFAWARLFGYRRTHALLAVAFFSLGFEPMMSVLRTGNVSQLQLAALVLCVLLPRRDGPGRGEFVLGALLGLTVMFKPNVALAVGLLGLMRVFEQRWRDLGRLSAGMALGAAGAAVFVEVSVGQHAGWASWWELLSSAFLETPPSLYHGNYTLAELLKNSLQLPGSGALLPLGVIASAALLFWRSRVAPGADPRCSDGFALALGSAVMLVAAPVAWLHYYNLAVPIAIFCLHPRVHRSGRADSPGWIVLVALTVLATALRPMLLIADPGGPSAYAWTTVLGTLALVVFAFIGVFRAPGLGALATDERPEGFRLANVLGLARHPGATLVVVGVLVYANSLGGDFHLDDTHRVVDNPAIRHVSLTEDLTNPLTSSSNLAIAQYRPLMPWSFSLNHALHGLSPAGYHLVNLLLHLVSSWLVFALLRELLVHWGPRRLEPELASRRALVAALLFCVHPVSGLVVNYISARDLAMMVMFLLAAFFGLVRMARLGDSPGRWVAILASFAAAMLSKSNAAVFPALVLLFGLVVEGRSLRDRLLWLRVAAPLALVGVLIAWSSLALGFSDFSTAGGPTSPWVYALIQLDVHVTHYLANFVWPWSINIAPGVDAAGSLGDPGAWLGLLVIAASIAVAIAQRRTRPLLTFGLLGYWLLLAPTSSLLPLHHFANHYRPYLASPFLLVAIVPIAAAALSPRLRVPISLVVIGWFALASLNQNAIWRSDESLWRHTVEVGGDQLAHLEYAMSIEDRSDPRVRRHLEQALALNPHYVVAHVNLAVLRFHLGETEAGLANLRETESRYPGWAVVPFWLGRLLERQGEYGQAADAFARATAIEPATLHYQYAAGRAYQQAGMGAESLPFLDACESLHPGHEDVRFLRGYALQMSARNAEAISSYRAHLAVAPDHVQTRFNLGYALMESGEHAAAAQHFRRTLELRPDYDEARQHLQRCEDAVERAAPLD